MSVLEKNLEGLRRWTPATAARIEGATIPTGFVPKMGTDGTHTFASERDGKVVWLGGTSMPRASARAITKSLDAGGGVNGLGLSIGTGFEWEAFAAKLGVAQVLFVYEMDAVLTRMALSVCDVAGLLESGKMVLVVGSVEEAGKELARFLAEHAGFEVPSVLHPLATLEGERRNALLSGGEAIARRVALERQVLVNALSSQWREEGKREGVVAITRGSRYAGERPLEFVKSVEEVRVDRHDACSLALRLKMIVVRRPERVVSDFFRGQLGCVPETVGVETWIPPMVGAGFWEGMPAAGTLAAEDRVVVHSGVHEAILLEKGFKREQIALRNLALRGKGNGNASGYRVAMIADVGGMDAGALGVTLPTHQAVFAAAKEILREEYLTAHFGAASDVLRRAMERAGVAAGGEDVTLRETMMKLIRQVLLPNVPVMTMAGELQRMELPVKLIGDWSGMEVKAGTVVERFGGSDQWSDVAVLVHLSPWGVVSPLVGEAIAAGVVVISPQHATEEMAGSLAKLLVPEVEYVRPSRQQFVAALKGLLKDEKKRGEVAGTARKKLIIGDI